VLDKLHEVEATRSLSEFWLKFEKVILGLGFDGFVYTIASKVGSDFYYHDNVGLHDPNDASFYDPFLEFCCHSYDPTPTGVEFMADYPYIPQTAVDFIRQAARKTGMISGLGIPVRLAGSNRYGGFNLLTQKPRKEFEPFILDLQERAQLLCVLAQRHIEQLLDSEQILMEGADQYSLNDAEKLDKLTARERDVLRRLVDGSSRKSCAQQLSLAESTVDTHIKSIYRKLEVHNRVEATKIAFQGAL
jgi:DNA-binding CsgD family transcriptional regulator